MQVSFNRIILSTLFTIICLTINAQPIGKDFFTAESVTIPTDSTASIRAWFKTIENKGITLSYSSSNINLEEKIKLKRQKLSIQKFLNAILYKYDFNVVYTSKRKILIQFKGAKKFSLSGTVSDKDSKETLNKCIVFIQSGDKKSFQILTDSCGCFSVQLPFDKYTIKAYYIGYRFYESEVYLDRGINVDIEMKQTAVPLQEIQVKSAALNISDYKKDAPGLLSPNHNDPFARINSLPGVTGTSVSGDQHVNGGQNDENLILLDGVPLYHSHHNNSLLAQFNGDVVKKISFFDSFIPAKYEGRLSSVTDVRIKEGDGRKHHQTLGLELPSASVTFDGPVIKDRLTYMLSGRHSWIDFMKELFTDDSNSSRTFKDLTAKISYTVNPRLSIQGLLYRSKDQYNDSIGIYKNHKILEWKSNLYSISSQAILAKEIQNTNIISFTEYTNSIYAPVISIPSSLYINEGMRNFRLKSDFSKKLDKYVDLSWGFSTAHERFKLLAQKDSVENTFQKVTKLSSYINTQIKFSDKLYTSIAMNLVAYLPKNDEKYFSMQPRFTLKFMPDTHNTCFFDFSRMEQFYHNICEGEIPIPTDFRMPSIGGFKPTSSVFGEVGWKHLVKNAETGISVFYKRRFRILSFHYNFDEEFKNGWNDFIKQGNAHSYGIKIHTTGQWNKWKYNFSYTFSKCQEWFKDFDNQKKNPALHDIPHIFHCTTSYMINKKTIITMGGYIQSGTLVDIFYVDNNVPDKISSYRKRDRLNYRLDFNYTGFFISEYERFRLSYKIGLYNIVGNPKEKEIIDLYSIETRKHCLPYFTLNLKF